MSCGRRARIRRCTNGGISGSQKSRICRRIQAARNDCVRLQGGGDQGAQECRVDNRVLGPLFGRNPGSRAGRPPANADGQAESSSGSRLTAASSRKSATTWGSNWEPEWMRISFTAKSTGRAG